MATDSKAPADRVQLFTDGACSGNPGPGGWAYILKHPASGKVLEASGAEPATTNNRMELTGVIEGLASLKRPCGVE
ncbi:MAG: ribonuclease HI, partial [Planctomycetaceae bacterium]|nr:ribonuclease HI [Planctomycetaceae bacterium]MBV8317760.1 ribonuclease HI [Planctomycetaceae bacterium]